MASTVFGFYGYQQQVVKNVNNITSDVYRDELLTLHNTNYPSFKAASVPIEVQLTKISNIVFLKFFVTVKIDTTPNGDYTFAIGILPDEIIPDQFISGTTSVRLLSEIPPPYEKRFNVPYSITQLGEVIFYLDPSFSYELGFIMEILADISYQIPAV